jgi:hypothetical protein
MQPLLQVLVVPNLLSVALTPAQKVGDNG